MPKGIHVDYTNEVVGRLTILGPVPSHLKKYKSNTKEWYCRCKCGTELQLETRMISGTGKYTQQSCGCIRAQAHLVATTRIENLTMSFIEKFSNFTKYQFLHKSYVKIDVKNYDWNSYKDFMIKFYYDKQFNKIYDTWEKYNNDNTYYDWYKPSIDHIIPKSRIEGSNHIDNLQFLTVFENLAKRDMTEEEWKEFKIKTNTQSELFIRSEGGMD